MYFLNVHKNMAIVHIFFSFSLNNNIIILFIMQLHKKKIYNIFLNYVCKLKLCLIIIYYLKAEDCYYKQFLKFNNIYNYY